MFGEAERQWLCGRRCARDSHDTRLVVQADLLSCWELPSTSSQRGVHWPPPHDVQPPEPLDLWTTLPFDPTIRDGALYARGARDDKREFVARVAAVDAVRAAHGGELPCNVLYAVLVHLLSEISAAERVISAEYRARRASFAPLR